MIAFNLTLDLEARVRLDEAYRLLVGLRSSTIPALSL